MIPTAREVNDFMPRRMARIVEEALAASGRKIKGARVAVLGFTYRENTDDTRNSPAKIVIQELRRRGAEIAIHDPFARSERGYAILQDVNAAKNILAAGLAVARGSPGDACGGDVRHSGSSWVRSPAKQEPRSATAGIPVLQGGE